LVQEKAKVQAWLPDEVREYFSLEKNEKLIKPKPIDNTNIIKSIFCFDKQYIKEFTEDAQATLKK
jgi:hypothetical protein